MAEYIDREKLIKEIDKGDLLVGNNAEWAKEIVYRTPTEDVVPVVRCKDCVYNKGQLPVPEDNLIRCHREMPKLRKPHDYCSYDERKHDNANTSTENSFLYNRFMKTE